MSDLGNFKWESLIGFLDLFILSRCNFVALTFSSNFGRLVYELMHVDDPNPFIRYVSLDSKYYIHGFHSDLLTKNYNL